MNAPYPWRPTPHRLWVGLRICGLLLALRLLLPCLKLQTLLKWLTPSASCQGGAPQELEQVVWWTDSILRFVFPWQGKCLPRTLTLYAIATRSGYPVQVKCGVRRDGSKLQGHAWLSLHGAPFFEKDDPEPHYASVFAFPQAKRSGDSPGLDTSLLSTSPSSSGLYR